MIFFDVVKIFIIFLNLLLPFIFYFAGNHEGANSFEDNLHHVKFFPQIEVTSTKFAKIYTSRELFSLSDCVVGARFNVHPGLFVQIDKYPVCNKRPPLNFVEFFVDFKTKYVYNLILPRWFPYI